jgi:hypothetical protein
MADIAVDRSGVGPIGLHGHDGIAVPFDQPAGDGGAGAVELRRAVARLAQQHHTPAGEAVERRAEGRIVRRRQRLGRLGDHLGKRAGRRASGHVVAGGAGAVLGPSLVADQRHEGHAAQVLLLVGVLARPGDLQQALAALLGADGHDQPAADRELVLQRLRDRRPAGRDQDGVERRRVRPSQRAVAGLQDDVAVTQALNARPRQARQRVVALDGMDAGGDPAGDGGGIARSGSDLEHFVAGLDAGRLQHQGDDAGLGNGLAFADGQRAVLIGEFLESLVHERIARHAPHGVEDGGVADTPARDLGLHHPFTGLGKIGHGSAPCFP